MSSMYIAIGAPGEGKSEWVKKILIGPPLRKCFVYDVQNEYGSRTKYKGQIPLMLSDNPNHERARYINSDNIEGFMLQCKQKRDTIIVFEEATIFFEGRTGKLLRSLMVNRWHTGNVYIFLFHSINSVPPRIMEMCNYIVLHRTLDENHIVQWKYGRLFHHYLDLQEMPRGSRKIIKMM